MDSAWEFRKAYDEGRKLKEAQDRFCDKAGAGLWDDLGEFPEDLQWEALADVLRGRVKASHMSLLCSDEVLTTLIAFCTLLRGISYNEQQGK